MLSEFSPIEPEVEKEGVLSKLGGGAGGHKNWKDRYFVLTDHLYYYGSKAEYKSDPKNPLGRVNLLSYFVARSDPDTNEFCVHSYPKVRRGAARAEAAPLCPSPASISHVPNALLASPLCALARPAQSLTCRASSKDELDDWINAIMAPLDELRKVKEEAKGGAAASGGGGSS